MNLACALLLLLLVAPFCQLCSAWPWEETASSTPFSSSSSITTSDWFWDDNTASRELTPSLETTTASSFSTTSSWAWDWEQETSSTTSSFSSSSTSSAEDDWYLTPTSTVSEATSSVPSIDMLFAYMYEALERDHLGMKRKRREVEEPSLPKKRDVAARGNKINPFMLNRFRKRKLLG
ncbi:A-agglutinin anchorage subunit-like [Orbicella faveolata]|uniref:A-agglutinin anchorage subunit-like n=1 Tax=Orbicella faveolata TaxID=48498 RepID=UPI0009E48FB4|nr:A-agglutinin anchorage subunit-like [Orbicella faveolata]